MSSTLASMSTSVVLKTLWLTFILSPFHALAEPAKEPRQTNVLFIISDDQGYGDFGFTGNKLVQTPHLDRLAMESAVFENFVVAPACSPSRAAFFTGRAHLLTGVWGVPPRANLLSDEIRMPAYFKAAGYRTLHVGKLDCVKVGKADGQNFGWDDWIGGGGYEQKDPMIYSSNGHRRESGWTADLWTDATIRYIKENQDRPWFVSLAYIIPHLPWECAEEYRAPFLRQGCSEDLSDCYGSIAQMDANIGRLLKALEETGQADRTLVVFVSDNGATGPETKKASADGRVTGEDWQKRNTAGLRGAKASVWENGIRVPLLMRLPERIRPGGRRQCGQAEDILPTLLELTGVQAKLVSHLALTGVSLAPALRNAATVVDRPPSFRIAISGSGSPHDGLELAQRRYENHHLTLRGARFKYHSFPNGHAALYDLETDPGEDVDVQQKFPDVLATTAEECRARWDAVIASGRSFALPAE